jgi:hypothetical protein
MSTQTRSKGLAVMSLTFVALILVSIPILGHHGTGISYDQDKWVAVTGTVIEFAWKNPHSQLYLAVTDEKGNTVRWGLEMSSPGVMIRQGWTNRQFKPGDQVTVNVHPSRTGAPVGECIPCAGTLNGKELPKPLPANEAQPAATDQKQ